MKITIYDLIGLVKDGKAPKEIKYKNFVYGWVQKYKTYTRYDITGKDLYITTNNLNDEVEIIEESKKIEKWGEGALEEMENCTDYTLEDLQKYIRILAETQNELIDEINNLKENKYE